MNEEGKSMIDNSGLNDFEPKPGPLKEDKGPIEGVVAEINRMMVDEAEIDKTKIVRLKQVIKEVQSKTITPNEGIDKAREVLGY